MTIEDYFSDWWRVIDKVELAKILKILDTEYTTKSITPEKSDVFKAFRLCPLKDLKVVMIGQDPFPQKGIATGVLFGNKSITPECMYSPSLKIIKEAVINPEVPQELVQFDPTMEYWAKQGVLMINSALTVEVNNIGSHTMLWRGFISKFLNNLSELYPGMIYVLFGGQAQTFEPYIGKTNIIFKEKHPAYYARLGQRFKTTLFEDINNVLKQRNNLTIKWYEYL